MVMAVEVLVALCTVSSHFVWPFEERFVLNLLQNLPDRLSKHCTNHLDIGRPRLSCMISSRPVIIVSVRPEIPHFLKDNLSLPFSLLLVIFDSLVLINSVHELA